MAILYESKGIRNYDAIHLATAETNSADIFLTTDDTLLKRGTKAQAETGGRTRLANPKDYTEEITK